MPSRLATLPASLSVDPSRLGVAVVGVGRWGSKIVRALSHVREARLVAVCDGSPMRARAAATALAECDRGLDASPRALSRAREAFALPSVQAVVLATPPETHAALGLEVLDAGLHLMVEKPMATRLRDALALGTRARRRGVTLMVGHVLNYHLGVERLERLLNDGRVGEARAIFTERFAPRPTRDDPWWTLAPHDVSLCQRLLSHAVTGVSARRARAGEVVGQLELGSRRRATVVVSHRLERPRRSRLTVYGSRASLRLDDGPGGALVQVGRAMTSRELSAFQAAPDRGDAPSPPPFCTLESFRFVEPTPAVDTPLVRELAHFCRAALSGVDPLTGAVEGASVVRALELGAQ